MSQLPVTGTQEGSARPSPSLQCLGRLERPNCPVPSCPAWALSAPLVSPLFPLLPLAQNPYLDFHPDSQGLEALTDCFCRLLGPSGSHPPSPCPQEQSSHLGTICLLQTWYHSSTCQELGRMRATLQYWDADLGPRAQVLRWEPWRSLKDWEPRKVVWTFHQGRKGVE
jgi:hypothetical protein